MKNKIRNIIFDLGGVILNIDYQKTEKAFEKIGFPHFAELYTQFKQTDLFVKFEKGQISPGNFLAKLKQEGVSEVSEKAIIDAWNAMLLDLPQEHLEVLKKLRTNYHLILLSNTNAIHYECFFDRVEKLTGKRDLSDYFEKEYYSHLIGKRKPDPEVFEYIAKEHQIKVEETLFIDDSPQHLETADKLNFYTFLKKQGQTLPEALEPVDL